jgi:hypothetical protein
MCFASAASLTSCRAAGACTCLLALYFGEIRKCAVLWRKPHCLPSLPCPTLQCETHVKLYLSYFYPQLVTGIKMVTFPLWKPLVASTLKVSGHAKDMEAFYKYQKEGYDSFREGLLHARPALMEAFPLKKGGGMVWIDIGGGTARNLEFFSVRRLLALV